MFGIRQKLAFGFGGLLLILLGVSAMGTAVLLQYQSAMDRFSYENWRSVEYGLHISESVEQLDEIAGSLEGTTSDSAAFLSASAAALPLLKVADANCIDENHNITVEGERSIAVTLNQYWWGKTIDRNAIKTDNYRSTFLHLLDPGISSQERAAIAGNLRQLSSKVRSAARDISQLNSANLRPVGGRAKSMADRAIKLIISSTAIAAVLAIAFTLLMTRSILRPLTTITRSIREIEEGNLNLVLQVKSRDELHQLAEAFNSMTAKLREFRRSDRAKLFRTQQTTQLAINSLPDAVAVTGPDGTIELSNDTARKLFGLTPGLNMVQVPHARILEIYEEVTKTKKPNSPRGYESAIEIHDSTGQVHYYLPHAVPITDHDNQLPGVTLVLAEVTNLRKLDEMKSGLLSVVSHELKTPLTSFRMAVHLLLEEKVGPLTAKQIELVVTARDESERLDKIISSLLDMGRLETGHAALNLQQANPAQIIARAIDPLRSTFSDKGLQIKIDLPIDLPAVAVDPARIGYVVSNLLTNALKFTPRGGRVDITAEAIGSSQVRFTVSDSGIGIAPEHLPHVFERFFRVPGTPDQIAGAGLGLAIAREIIQLHGGEMSVQSKIGEGTQFSFTLNQMHNLQMSEANSRSGAEYATQR